MCARSWWRPLSAYWQLVPHRQNNCLSSRQPNVPAVKRPRGATLKLLSLIKSKGLEAVL
jgi:hypothetical protein